ncbi:hypothetical protein K502DRAFT_326182, partial [Neoconidiobolus thromboides FSU 785]
MGKEYPKGYNYFKDKLKSGFQKNKELESKEDIDKAIKHGQFIIKELEALYFLKKYRTVKERYY